MQQYYITTHYENPLRSEEAIRVNMAKIYLPGRKKEKKKKHYYFNQKGHKDVKKKKEKKSNLTPVHFPSHFKS